MKNRDQHLQWCKDRALKYLAEGDVVNAVASMASDLDKHPETKCESPHLLALGMLYSANYDAEGARRWIEGFR